MLDRDETKPVRTAITGAPSEPAIRWGLPSWWFVPVRNHNNDLSRYVLSFGPTPATHIHENWLGTYEMDI